MKLCVEACGAGPELVLLHGWGVNSSAWTPLLPELAQRFRLTLVDLPGHGHSAASGEALDLTAMAQAVAGAVPQRATWLGWSLGGQVALAAALAGADIERLVLVATTPRFVSETGWSCGVAPGTLAGFAAALAQDHRKTVQQFLALQLRGEQLASALMATLQQLLAERPPPAPGALRDGLAILAGTDLRNRLGEIRQPALVIAGARDRLTPAEAGRRLAAALPGGQFLAFEHAAHVPFLTDPDRFVTALADFLPGRVTTA